MRKEGKTLLFLNLLVLFCVHQSKISIIVVQMRQKRIKLERINDDFLKKKRAHRVFFSNKAHSACKFLPCYAKQGMFFVLA